MRPSSAATLLALTFIAGCSDSYDDQVARLESHVKGNKIGSSNDFWLVKRSFGVDDRVALMFGYMNDFSGCDEIAQMLNERYPGTGYICIPAN